MQESKIVKLLKIIPAGAYNGAIWFLSSKPMPVSVANFDKTAHIIEYSIMGFLLAFAFELCRKNFNSSAKYCMIFGFMAGGLDELHQYFVPGRTMDIFDFIADITGIITGIIVWLLFAKLLTFLKSSFLSKKA